MAEVYARVYGDALAEETLLTAIEVLNAAYETEGRAFRLYPWAGGYRMATVAEVAPFLKALFEEQKQHRLSRSLMETLAIVAYRQPVAKSEVDFVRGVDSEYTLRKLLERTFIAVAGRSEAVGRPLLYKTTDFFLEQFGLDTLEGLPKIREIEELLHDPAFDREKAKLLALDELHPSTGNGSLPDETTPPEPPPASADTP